MAPIQATKIVVLLLAIGICAPARAADAPPVRLYEITTETGMPHLEENLRYAITHEERCLSEEQLFVGFPVLNHVALRDCTLSPEGRNAEAVSYLLACNGGHGTTGHALWRLDEAQLRGRLDVKLGGKNMTFYQRVTARPLGACVAEAQ
jgi:hypothetical protein